MCSAWTLQFCRTYSSHGDMVYKAELILCSVKNDKRIDRMTIQNFEFLRHHRWINVMHRHSITPEYNDIECVLSEVFFQFCRTYTHLMVTYFFIRVDFVFCQECWENRFAWPHKMHILSDLLWIPIFPFVWITFFPVIALAQSRLYLPFHCKEAIDESDWVGGNELVQLHVWLTYQYFDKIRRSHQSLRSLWYLTI